MRMMEYILILLSVSKSFSDESCQYKRYDHAVVDISPRNRENVFHEASGNFEAAKKECDNISLCQAVVSESSNSSMFFTTSHVVELHYALGRDQTAWIKMCSNAPDFYLRKAPNSSGYYEPVLPGTSASFMTTRSSLLKQHDGRASSEQGLPLIREEAKATTAFRGFRVSVRQIPLPGSLLTESALDSWCTYEKCRISPRTYYHPVTTNFAIAAFTDSHGQGHVFLLDESQNTRNHVITKVNGVAAKVAGIYGFHDGSFAASLFVDADRIQDRGMFLQFYRADLSVKWSTLLNSAIAVPDRNVGDFRLTYGDGFFAAYFSVFGVDNFANATNGEQLSFVDDRGRLKSTSYTIPGQIFVKTGDAWVCSHGLAQLVDYHSVEQQFVVVCGGDLHPKGISLGDSQSGTLLYRARGDGRGRASAQLGQLAESEFGWKLLFNSVDSGIGFVSIYNEKDAVTDQQAFEPIEWIKRSESSPERDPVIARIYPRQDLTGFGESYLVGWRDVSRDQYLLGITDTFGTFNKEPMDMSSLSFNDGNLTCSKQCLSWGERDDSLKTLPDGSVGWFFVPPSSPSVWLYGINTISDSAAAGSSLWSGWVQCSKSCGSGITTRVRSCQSQDCNPSGAVETKPCNTPDCTAPVKCTFTEQPGAFEGDLFVNGLRQFAFTPVAAKEQCAMFRDLCSGITRGASGGFYFYFLKTSTTVKTSDRSISWTMSCAESPGWAAWSTWISCSVTCGGGSQTRYRFCDGDVPGSAACMGNTDETQKCNTGRCPDWSSWTDWTSCSATCDEGSQDRTRVCVGDYPEACQKLTGRKSEQRFCSMGKCPEWGEWKEWGECSATCGEGTQKRTRECRGDFPCFSVPGAPSDVDSRPCNVGICPYWSDWSLWSDCGASCGESGRFRNRACLGDFPTASGCPLKGEMTETENCNLRPCPFWDEWVQWGACSVSCDGGQRTRSRDCIGDISANLCPPGDTSEQEDCNLGACARWDAWLPWSRCSASCGDGLQTRFRDCLGDFPCTYSQPSTVSERCNLGECPSWGPWSPWGPCAVTCGADGLRTRWRQCLGDFPELCDDSGFTEAGPCLELSPCPRWSQWTVWSACSVTCGVGLFQRKRTCGARDFITCNIGAEDTNPWNSTNISIGHNALGLYEMLQSENCTLGLCSYWLEWTTWEACSATCDEGTRQRSRNCFGDFPHMCAASGFATDVSPCTRGRCGSFSDWSPWSTCSNTCGAGQWSRSRGCLGDFATTCFGPFNQTSPCNVGDCVPECAPNPCKNEGVCRRDFHLTRLYRCICPNGWVGKHCDYVGPDLMCGSDNILIAFDRRVVEEEELIANDPRYVSLASRDSIACHSVIHRSNNMDWYLIVVPSPVDTSCGSVLEITPTEYRVHNRIIWQAEEKTIRSTVILLDFMCAYQRSLSISSQFSSHGALSVESYKREINMVTSSGVFEVDISLFRDSIYQSQINPITSSSLVSLDEGEVVFVSVDLKSKDLLPSDDAVLVMETCFVTSQQSTREPLTYLFQERCPASPFVVLISNGESRSGKFSVRVFGWTGRDVVAENVYIHCTVSVCDAAKRDCKPECDSSRRKRSPIASDGSNGNDVIGQYHHDQENLRAVFHQRPKEPDNGTARRRFSSMSHNAQPYTTIIETVPPLPDGNAAVNLSTSFSRIKFDPNKMVSAGPLEIVLAVGIRQSREIHEDAAYRQLDARDARESTFLFPIILITSCLLMIVLLFKAIC